LADQSLKEFVMDQLRVLPELRAKPMFGGYGLYQSDQFFGILIQGRLYFKTDEQTRRAYTERGMGPFVYEKARRPTTLNYFEVPPDVLENRESLLARAQLAVASASVSARSDRKASASGSITA